MTEKIQYNSEVSRRYSKALFKLAADKSAEKKIYDEISSLLNFMTDNEKFNHIDDIHAICKQFVRRI